MQACKCDVCGVLYEHYAVKKDPNSLKLLQVNKMGWPGYEHEYDLCPECMAAICELIENRKIGGANNE